MTASLGLEVPRVLVVTAADHRFMPLLRGMLASLSHGSQRTSISLACLDGGLSPADLRWLKAEGVRTMKPGAHFGLNMADHPATLLPILAKPFLQTYFPGYDVYVWIDCDAWLQDIAVLNRYIEGALTAGFAIAHESARGYRFQPWLLAWMLKHFLLGCGPLATAWLLSRDHLNSGLFAGRANAPQWASCYATAVSRTGALYPYDQFALNKALHRRPGLACFLDPGCNWICDRGPPMWNDAEGHFCKPYPPFEAIGVLHLAGVAKWRSYRIRRTGGGVFETFLVHGASPIHPVTVCPLDAVEGGLEG